MDEAAEQGGRRVRRAPEEARRLILEATRRLLGERGPDAIGLKDIAREAGVSHGLVSHYFGTLDQVIEEAFAAHVRGVRAAFLEKVASESTADVAAWVQHLLDVVSDPTYGRLTLWALMSGRVDSEAFFTWRDQGLAQVAAALTARLGTVSREEVDHGVVIALCAVLGYALGANAIWGALGQTRDASHDRGFAERLAALLTAAAGR